MMFSASHHDQMMLPCPPWMPPLPTMETRWKHNLELAPNCPRCASPNTKFCYYNNYSLSQPRYFCKGCRRYWTKGGSLRNVPVGGGCRKSRRSKSSRMAADQRAGMGNYGKNSTGFGAPVDDQSLSPSSVESMAHGQTGSDIDLAEVFSKFLNQDGLSTAFEPEGSSGFVGHQELLISEANESLNVSNSLTLDSVQREAKTTSEICHQKHSSDLIQECSHHDQLLQQQPDNQVPLGEQELVIESDHDQDMNAFGLQTLLGDEMVQDALWSDAAASTSFDPSNITCWHPMVQLQELDPFAMEDEDDDQLRINCPANFVSDNCWSTASLDLPGFDFFSRP